MNKTADKLADLLHKHDDHWNGHEFECTDLSLISDKESNRKRY